MARSIIARWGHCFVASKVTAECGSSLSHNQGQFPGSLRIVVDDIEVGYAAVISNTFILVPSHVASVNDLANEVVKEQDWSIYLCETIPAPDGQSVPLGQYVCSATGVKFGSGDFVIVQIRSANDHSVVGPIKHFEDLFLFDAPSGTYDYDKLDMENPALPGDSGLLVQKKILLGGVLSSRQDDGSYTKLVMFAMKEALDVLKQSQTVLNSTYDRQESQVDPRDAPLLQTGIFVEGLDEYVALSLADDVKRAIQNLPQDGGRITYEIKPREQAARTVNLTLNKYDRTVFLSILAQKLNRGFLPYDTVDYGGTQCWVKHSMLENVRIYTHVGRMAHEAKHYNFDNNGAQYPHDKALQITGITRAVLLTEATKDDAVVCHHPLLCEYKSHFDDRLKKNGVHTCIRPSHLLLSSGCLNDLHTKLNQIMHGLGDPI
ncbi:uncharacterized protein MONBRDRAFT_37171 [Monosiga brevicollis MX1]|uniref:Uncharacterized protein n=1 Tax=Monosiga brevicollis TaxID=81824 RepID=A9V016_MONBE|nr:uncharacterized protein MONBRDRAFT_37171 [Monosiga brevicollis MX1]EDQ88933.1 predicted protein [Monosiga brevicollis MX1]|eukprot:XP_001746038.1 hypothetical protein [Monosiga brevicollis MX1]